MQTRTKIDSSNRQNIYEIMNTKPNTLSFLEMKLKLFKISTKNKNMKMNQPLLQQPQKKKKPKQKSFTIF